MFNYILVKAHDFLEFIINLLPDSEGFPSEVATAFSSIGSYFKLLDAFVPTNHLLIALGIVFGVEIALNGFKGFRWIISHIPFIGGKGV